MPDRRRGFGALRFQLLRQRGGGASRVAKLLLSDFAARFAGDPRVAVAQSLAQHLG